MSADSRKRLGPKEKLFKKERRGEREFEVKSQTTQEKDLIIKKAARLARFWIVYLEQKNLEGRGGGVPRTMTEEAEKEKKK